MPSKAAPGFEAARKQTQRQRRMDTCELLELEVRFLRQQREIHSCPLTRPNNPRSSRTGRGLTCSLRGIVGGFKISSPSPARVGAVLQYLCQICKGVDFVGVPFKACLVQLPSFLPSLRSVEPIALEPSCRGLRLFLFPEAARVTCSMT